MDSAARYDIEFYSAKQVDSRNVYVVVIYSGLDTVVDISVYDQRWLAEEEAKRQTGSTCVVPAGKDVDALLYVIGEDLFAEIHEKVVI